LLLAESHAIKGEFEQAKVLYQTVLAAFPNNQHARQSLDHLNTAKPVQGAGEHPPKGQMDALIALFHQGNFKQASEKAEHLAQDFPMSFVVWNVSGIINNMLGLFEKAEACFRRAIYIHADYAEAHANLGNILKEQGKLDQAIASFQHALKIKPDYAIAHYNMGNALSGQGKLNEAIASYQHALRIKPDYAEALNNMGDALSDQGKLDDAVATFRRALDIEPDFAEAHNNMGKALRDQDKLDEAIASYQRALKIKPDYAEAHNNMGVTLQDRGKLDEAVASYQKALKIKPDNAEALINLGATLQDQGKLDEAIASYQKGLNIKPDNAAAQTQMLHQLQHICDFERTTRLADFSATLGIDTAAVSPFAALSWADDPEHQLARSRNWANEKFKKASTPFPVRSYIRPPRIRIGYFSTDFNDHPLLILISGLMREHDRAGFEVFAFSYSKKKSGERRQKLISDVEHFFDVAENSDQEILKLARSNKIDIAVDLTGYTKNSRSEIFQLRLAPIQISFLGYPSTMGAPFIDYILADRHLIPDSQRAGYSEKVFYMPHTYMPIDNTRQIAQSVTTRADFGLPKAAVVLCCFNNSYKISSREFVIWMRLLRKIEGSVLWLLKGNKWAVANLRKEALRQGIDPSRLIFADLLPHAEHLARHKHADIFVDTFNYNAHTTAVDALWAGLPVVTKQGNQFAARVAASLLTAVGLPELITQNETDYEALILDLATSPHKLQALREKLAINRLTQPLFDTQRYTRDFEAGLTAAFDLYYTDQDPQDIWV